MGKKKGREIYQNLNSELLTVKWSANKDFENHIISQIFDSVIAVWTLLKQMEQIVSIKLYGH